MTSWIGRTQTNDFDRAREIAEGQRNRGYKVWIEDENGVEVDEQGLRKEKHHRSPREIAIAALVWLVAVTVGLGGLYLMGVWFDGVW